MRESAALPRPPVRPPALPAPRAFERAPLVVIWEVTRACDLLCVHCRADAIPRREPEELTTAEGALLLDEVRRFGHPRLVLTGGDPLKRSDICELIAYGNGIGLHMALSPSATPLLTRQTLERAARCGLGAVSISIDGPDAATHDAFRGVPGTFQRSLAAAQAVVDLGMELHVNTTVTRHNLVRLQEMVGLVGGLGARRWSLFFLVPVGRATDALQLAPAEFESVFVWLDRLADSAPLRVKTTEGPQFRRVVLQQWAARSGEPPGRLLERTASAGRRFIPGMNDGRGFVFVSWRGDIQPSGFLPLRCGNVRTVSLVETYQSHPVFMALRNPDWLQGRCGACEYRAVCGGSRARAFAACGDPLAEDPACAYRPPAVMTSGRGAGP